MSSHIISSSVLIVIILVAIIFNDNFIVVQAANYTGHAIVRVPLEHVEPLVPYFNDTLHNGEHFKHDQFEVLWTGQDANETFAVLRVPPEKHARVRRSTRNRFLIPNLQQWINDNSFFSSPFNSPLSSSASTISGNERGGAVFSSLVSNFRLDRYQPLHEVYRYLQEANIGTEAHERVTLFDLGTTHEGRKIKAIEIIGNPADKRLVWIDGCTHAREWITVATALYIIEQAIITQQRTNFVIVPVLNPDGYEYTWNSDRLWRKNRRPASSSRSRALDSTQDNCNGVDLNRNYDLNFGGTGSSSNQCSHLYSGPSALSEPETQAVANLLWAIRGQVLMFVSLHSFNQLWSCPYAYTNDQSPHHQIHMDMLRTIQDAVYRTNGVQYKIGPLGSSLYLGSGFALDWAYSNAKIMHSYLVELRDEGQFGFLLPVDQIMPTVTETWNGIRAGIVKLEGKR